MSFFYDALNRLTLTQYAEAAGVAATPDVHRCYDGNTFTSGACTTDTPAAPTVGRLTAVGTVGLSAGTFGYDDRGRVIASSQTFLGEVGTPGYTFSYWYNPDGNLRTVAYPSGMRVSTCYDYAGRPLWATSKIDLANLLTYDNRCTGGLPPTGEETFYVRGAEYSEYGGTERQELGNQLWEFASYNNRGQVDDMRLGTTQDGSDVWR